MPVFNGTPDNDIIDGTSGDDLIRGFDGNDIINGGFGPDYMYGGAGDDTYYVDDSNDRVGEGNGEGTDTVRSSVSFSAGGQYIENITLIGYGHINATGNGEDNILTGNDNDNVLNGGAGADTMAGGYGDDTYYVDNPGDVVTETANHGTDIVFASTDYVLGVGQSVESLTLYGSAVKAGGNGLDNLLTGNDGNNILNGNGGADTMIGGKGDDLYYVDNPGDRIVEAYGQGYDTVYASIDYSLVGTYAEKLVLTGSAIKAGGNGLDNFLVGNDLGNVLNGNTGADVMKGGLGNDTYYIDNAGDVVVEQAGQGTDLVSSSISYTLAANVENLTLTGQALNATGNDLDNRLIGNASNNVLDGKAGADTMMGGGGNDTYYVDNPGDIVSEGLNHGTDMVEENLTSYALSANVENLIMLAGAVNATGNNLANTIYGNDGDNLIRGGGLSGGDVLYGGAGNDTYYISGHDNGIGESVGGGDDVVYAANGFVMNPGQEIETVILTGTASNNLYGNEFNNILIGGPGNDSLDGGGGVDTMAGGAGNDSYYVDNTGDIITENAGEGTDWVFATASYVLPANVENLTILAQGSINATGNDLANVIAGYSGANIIDGRGGNDKLTGGGGSDTFVFEPGSGADIITDFSAQANDKIDVSAYTHGVAHPIDINGSVTNGVISTTIDLGGGNTIAILNWYPNDKNLLSHIIW